MIDLLLIKCGEHQFSWGANSVNTPLEVEGKTREEYIKALRMADNNDFSALIKFARS